MKTSKRYQTIFFFLCSSSLLLLSSSFFPHIYSSLSVLWSVWHGWHTPHPCQDVLSVLHEYFTHIEYSILLCFHSYSLLSFPHIWISAKTKELIIVRSHSSTQHILQQLQCDFIFNSSPLSLYTVFLYQEKGSHIFCLLFFGIYSNILGHHLIGLF